MDPNWAQNMGSAGLKTGPSLGPGLSPSQPTGVLADGSSGGSTHYLYMVKRGPVMAYAAASQRRNPTPPIHGQKGTSRGLCSCQSKEKYHSSLEMDSKVKIKFPLELADGG